MNIYITRKASFSASHRLFNPNWTNEKNEQVYDKCNNYYGHGHNYKIEVTVVGQPDKESGYVIDLKILKKIIEEEIIIKVDHKHLNYDVDFLSGQIPTVENIIIAFWNILKNKVSPAQLYRIKLYETDKNYVEYFGN
jgi:6-pyruvoyltetrahydropterin/6-carboxytetrahydropterin synthase